MPRNEALHAAVLADPDADEPRQVYADWLLAQGDPRGELINVQLQLARCQDPALRATLEQRERELWATHEATWRPQSQGAVKFDRGFISSMTWAPNFDAVLDWACLRKLSFWSVTPEPASLASLGATPALASVDTLELAHLYVKPEHLGALARAPYLSGVRDLSIHHCKLEPDEVAELGWWRHPRTLRRLSLSGNSLGPGGLVDIIDAPAFASLEHLDLGNTDVGADDVSAILAAQLPLVRLELYACALDPGVARAIANAPHLAGLRRLSLVHTGIGIEGLQALVASPYLHRELDLAIDGDVIGLEPVYANDQGFWGNSGWDGEPPAWLSQRFRVSVEGYPEPHGFVESRRRTVERMLADRRRRAELDRELEARHRARARK